MHQLLLFDPVPQPKPTRTPLPRPTKPFVEYIFAPRPRRPAPTEQIKLSLEEDQTPAGHRRSPFLSPDCIIARAVVNPHRYAPDVRFISLASLLEFAQLQGRTLRVSSSAGTGIDISIDLPAELQVSAELLLEIAFSLGVVAQERAGRLHILFGAPFLIRLAACPSISHETPIPVYVTSTTVEVAVIAAAVRSLPRQTMECALLAEALLKSPGTVQDHLQWGRRGVEAIALDIAGISKPTFVKLMKERQS